MKMLFTLAAAALLSTALLAAPAKADYQLIIHSWTITPANGAPAANYHITIIPGFSTLSACGTAAGTSGVLAVDGTLKTYASITAAATYLTVVPNCIQVQ